MLRQGDVLIVPVAEIPQGLTLEDRDDQGRVVLMHGEVTGHAHAIHERGARMFRASDDLGLARPRYLDVSGAPAVLRHEEHSHLTLPIGKYRVTRQKEYAPEAIRNVAD